jgi:hypothetical protein
MTLSACEATSAWRLATRNGAYERVWYSEPIGAEKVAFEFSVFLLTKAKAQQLKSRTVAPHPETPTEASLTLQLILFGKC